jgi:two-component sensor histidine kinase/HAMP domain-containing protein
MRNNKIIFRRVLSPFKRRFLWKLTLWGWSLVLLTLIAFTVFILPFQRRNALERMEMEAADIASTVIIANSSALIMEDYGTVVEYCVNLVHRSRSVLYLVIAKKDGPSLFFTKNGWEQRPSSGDWLPDTTKMAARIVRSRLVRTDVFEKPVVFSYIGIHWGFVHVGLSLDRYHASLRRMTAFLAGFAVLMAGFGFGVSVYWARRITRPVRLLDATAKRIAEGDLDVQVDAETDDELGSLASSFNTMTTSLKRERETLESKVQERTSLLQETNRALTREVAERVKIEESLEKYAIRLEGLQEIYRGIIAAKSVEEIACETLKHLRHQISKFDAAYLVLHSEFDRNAAVYRYLPDRRDLARYGEINRFETPRKGVPSGPDISFENDLTERPDLDDFEKHLLATGCRSFICVDLAYKEQAIGQLWFASANRDQFTPEDGSIVSQISRQLVVALEQSRLQEHLREQTVVLQNSLREKEVLLKEIHHRVKNNLQIVSSLLNLQAKRADDPRVLEIFQDSQNRIRSMALVHEKLYQSEDLSRIDFKDYIVHMVENIRRTFETRDYLIHFQYDLDALFLPIDTVIPLGLILNELLSNTFKYAFSRCESPESRYNLLSIRLRGARDDGPHVLEFSDNGIGLPDGIDPENISSLGLRMVLLLAQQIRGKVLIESRNGARFTVQFPKEPAR